MVGDDLRPVIDTAMAGTTNLIVEQTQGFIGNRAFIELALRRGHRHHVIASAMGYQHRARNVRKLAL